MKLEKKQTEVSSCCDQLFKQWYIVRKIILMTEKPGHAAVSILIATNQWAFCTHFWGIEPSLLKNGFESLSLTAIHGHLQPCIWTAGALLGMNVSFFFVIPNEADRKPKKKEALSSEALRQWLSKFGCLIFCSSASLLQHPSCTWPHSTYEMLSTRHSA